MPKKYLVYKDFSGGLNSKTNSRELKPNEVSQCNGLVVDEIGSARTVAPQTSTRVVQDHSATIKLGRGLFAFKSDYSYSSTKDTITARESEYIVIADKATSTFDLLGYDDQSNDHVLTQGLCDLGDSTACISVFYYANGVLRHSDAAFDGRQTTKIFGRIGTDGDKTLLGQGIAPQWFDEAQTLPKPTVGFVAPALSGTATGDTTSLIYAAPGASVGSITGMADAGDGTTTMTDSSHGLAVNDVITIRGTINYNGEHTVTNVPDANSFRVDVVFSENDNIGYWVKSAAVSNWQGWSANVTAAANGSRWLVAYDVANNDVWKITALDEANSDFTTSTNSSNWNGRSFDIYPFPGDGCLLEVYQSEGSTEGTWDSGEYEFGETFIYDGNQESLIKKMKGNNVQIDSNEVLYARVHISGLSNETEHNTYINKRLIGGRIYMRKAGTNNFWSLLLDMDYQVSHAGAGGGTRTSTLSEYEDWASVADADTGGEDMGWTDQYFEGFKSEQHTIKRLNPESYENINGYSPQEYALCFGDAVGMGWTASVVAGTRVFAANVLYYDPKDGKKKRMGDAIFYTPVAKYDIFPSSYKLEIAGNDGDEFTALAYFNGILFAFKKNSLFLIDISNIGNDASWRLLNKFEGMGTTGQWGVATTNYGIAWVSRTGVYLSQGKNPQNLILEKISYENWTTFYDTGSFGPAIGFDSSSNKLLITDDVDDLTEIKIFDIASKTWTNGNSLDSTAGWGLYGGSNTGISNMITFTGHEIENDADGGINRMGGILVYADPATGSSNNKDLFTVALTDTVASSFVLTTKDEDFGAPNIYKKIYEVNIEYLTDNTGGNIDVLYEINGNDVPNSSSTSLVTNQALSGEANFDNINTLNIKPSSAIKCTSISIRVQSNGNSTIKLKIKSIGIRYRILSTSSVDTETSSS